MEFELIEWGPFREAFPLLFRKGEVRELSAGTGWFCLLWGLSAVLEPLARAQRDAGETPMRVVQVKEKFGGLRFYIANVTAAALVLRRAAEERSFSICEACGEPGSTKSVGGWFKTLCYPHHQQARAEYLIQHLRELDHE